MARKKVHNMEDKTIYLVPHARLMAVIESGGTLADVGTVSATAYWAMIDVAVLAGWKPGPMTGYHTYCFPDTGEESFSQHILGDDAQRLAATIRAAMTTGDHPLAAWFDDPRGVSIFSHWDTLNNWLREAYQQRKIPTFPRTGTPPMMDTFSVEKVSPPEC